MLKEKKKDNPEPEANVSVSQQDLQTLIKGVGEALERVEELERKSERSDGAQVIAAIQAYATPPEHLSEFTFMSLRMVEPFSLADACHSILSPGVQSGKVSLSEVRRFSIYRHLRSVKGYLLDRCTKLAEQQEVNKGETLGEPWEVGGKAK